MGTYHQARGWYSQAEQEFRRAIALDPKSTQARAALARLFLAEGKKAEAEDLLKQAKHDFPDNSAGYRMLGDFYFTTGDRDRAAAEYETLHREHPTDVQVTKNYVQLLIFSTRLDEARKLNHDILKANPNDSDALIGQAQLQLIAGDTNGAIGTLQTVLKNDPNNAAAHYQLGMAFQKSGNLASAESEWREAVRYRPDMVEAQRSLALLALGKGDMAMLEQAAAQLINLRPAVPEGYALRAVSEINRKQFKAAEEDVRKAIALDPQSHLGYVQLGNLRLAQKQYRDAAEAFEHALDRDPNSTDALRGLMNKYLEQNQIEAALAAVNAQIVKAPGNSSFYDLLGSALGDKKKDLNSAEAAFRKSVELDKSNIDAVIKLAQVQAAKGDLDHAIATCQQAIKDHPRVTQPYILLGGLYESKGDWGKAAEAYQDALDIKPNDPLASNNLANVLLQTGGNLDTALSLAMTAQRGLPDSPQTADTLGWVYFQRGAYRPALSMLEQALLLQEKNKAPDNPNIHYHLGMAYEKTDQPARARVQLEHVLKIDPNYRAAAEIKKQLAGLKS